MWHAAGVVSMGGAGRVAVQDSKEGPVPTAPAGTLYRGREGMWSWVAHRVTGVLIFFFLFAHVMDTALVRVSPDTYDRVIDTYKNPIVNLMEVGLVAAVLYHALNGLRIMAIDFWEKGPRYQRQMLFAEITLWVVLMVPGHLLHAPAHRRHPLREHLVTATGRRPHDRDRGARGPGARPAPPPGRRRTSSSTPGSSCG